jgi:hypothetical protein
MKVHGNARTTLQGRLLLVERIGRQVEPEPDIRAVAGDRVLQHGLPALHVAATIACMAALFAVAASLPMQRLA